MVNEIIIQMIGYTAAIFISLNMLPQIFKAIKTKSVDDVSMFMLLFVSAGSLLWLVYGILLESMPIIVSDGFGTLTGFLLIGIKLKYNKK